MYLKHVPKACKSSECELLSFLFTKFTWQTDYSMKMHIIFIECTSEKKCIILCMSLVSNITSKTV